MRLIVVGCEYSGVTTLINGINRWGLERGIHHHLDDHFTIPDAFHLTSEEQQGMLDMMPAIKERFQRFQLVYHIRLFHEYEHILMGGFHIEEMVYGPTYYYPGKNIKIREYEPDLPKDVILVHLHASSDVIRSRMESDPHPHQLVPSKDVEKILDRYTEEVRLSWIKRKFAIDTSELTPESLLQTFLNRSVGYLNAEDGNTRVLKP
jgi:hypothetical protein